MKARNNPDSFSESDKEKAMEDLVSTYELLMTSIAEIRKVLDEDAPLEDKQGSSENPFNDSFVKNCEAYKLTSREVEIIKLIASGKSDKIIAEELFISFKTVQSHITKIFKKVKVNKRMDIIARLRSSIYSGNGA